MATPRLASPKPRQYQSVDMPSMHCGIVAVVAGKATVNLGLEHNNFVPTFSIQGGATEAALAYSIDWAYGTVPGTMNLLVYKRDTVYGAWVIATATVNVAFQVIEGSPVSLNG